MKAIIPIGSALLAMALAFSTVNAAAPNIATQFDFSPETTPGARKFYFETIPGHRYTLWRSIDLQNWTTVPGYPQTAAGLSIEHTFTQGTKEFFQIEAHDDQAPEVVSQYPAVDGFAVGRFADLSIELSDATGIDPASVRLTVGSNGPITLGASGLTISGNTIIYDSGDAALGSWGQTVTATIVAADTLGHTLTHSWSFRLEPQPQTAANIFVFGSPTAQRAGQTVRGPAATLATRFPAPKGPIKADDPPAWHIDSVLADRIVIAYEVGGLPSFTAGQLICNLTPATKSEIFYRRVLSTSDDPGALRLTVMTEEAPLADFVAQGAVSLSDNSVIFDLDGDGALASARALDGTLIFPEIPIDLSGSHFKLLEHGYETSVWGVTYKSGSGEALVDVAADEFYWKFRPEFRAGVEFGLSGVRSCEAVLAGNVSFASDFHARGLLLGAFSESTIWKTNLGKVAYVGAIGNVPVYTSLSFDFAVKTKAALQALVEARMTYRQEARAEFGVTYDQSAGFEWIRSFQASSPDMRGSASLSGESSLKISLEPSMTALVYGTAGFKASVEPSTKITTSISTPTDGGSILDGDLEASLDFVLEPAGWLFDHVVFPSNKPELSLNVWEGGFPLVARDLALVSSPQSQLVALGENVTFTCTVASPSSASFQWYYNGILMPGQRSRSLFLTNVNNGHAGSYLVKVSAGGQMISSAPASLVILPATLENLDTDRDGIPDVNETNTGIWISATDRGTDPNNRDSDRDGLFDGVESRSFIYHSRSDPGTDPSLRDTDGDGMDDLPEILNFRNPNEFDYTLYSIKLYKQNFNHLISIESQNWQNDSTIPMWYEEQQTRTPEISASAGESNYGRLYSFGLAGEKERAFGSISTGGTGTIAWGLLLQNDTGGSARINLIRYIGEQWRWAKTTGGPQSVSLWFRVTSTKETALGPLPATEIGTGWTPLPLGDIISKSDSPAVETSINGNIATNRKTINFDPDISVPEGWYLMLRWVDINHIGSDQALAIDDLFINWISN